MVTDVFSNESGSHHQSQENVLRPVIGHDWSVSILCKITATPPTSERLAETSQQE